MMLQFQGYLMCLSGRYDLFFFFQALHLTVSSIVSEWPQERLTINVHAVYLGKAVHSR